MTRGRCGVGLTARLEGENGILLGRNGDSVVSGRLKVPVFQRRQTLIVDGGAEALQHGLADDLSAFVDGDFDDYFALGVWPLPRVDHGIRSSNGQSGPNLVSIHGAAGQATVGKSRRRAVTRLRERCCLCIVFSW